jgi:hypothetical protein
VQQILFLTDKFCISEAALSWIDQVSWWRTPTTLLLGKAVQNTSE